MWCGGQRYLFELGRNIRIARQPKKMSQQDIASNSRVHRVRAGKIENGQTKSSLAVGFANAAGLYAKVQIGVIVVFLAVFGFLVYWFFWERKW